MYLLCCPARMRNCGLIMLLLAAAVLDVPTLLFAEEISEFIRNSKKLDGDCYRKQLGQPCVKVFCKNGTPDYRWSCQTNESEDFFGAFASRNCTYYNITESDYNALKPGDQSELFSKHRVLTSCKDLPREIEKNYTYMGYYYGTECPTEFPVKHKKYTVPIWSECLKNTPKS